MKSLAIHIPTGNYYSIAQVAAIKQVDRRTVQQWIDKGWLKSIYIGGAHLIEENEIENLTRPKPGRKPQATQSIENTPTASPHDSDALN